MKRTSKTLAAVAATLFLSGFGLAATTMAQDGGPDDGGSRGAPSDERAAVPWNPAPSEASFVPVTPCRLFDTRNAGGPLGNQQTRNFKVKGALGAQGGAADCGVPSGATAISLNLTAISQGGPAGFVRGWAAGQPPAQATLLNFSSALNASNSVEVPVCEGVCSKDLTLKTWGSANLIGDVLGYFVPQIHASVFRSGMIRTRSSRVISVERKGTGVYHVTIDRSGYGCNVAVTPTDFGGMAAGRAWLGANVVEVNTYSTAGARADLDFEVLVSC